MQNPRMPLPILTSARFQYRPLQQNDYAFLRRLHLDARVMKYICAGAKRTEEQTQKSLDAGLKLAQEHPGLGTWIIHPLEKTEPLGLAILRLPAADLNMHGFEIGYSVIPEFWGKGIATEAATRLIQYAFNELKLYRVVAIIDPQHAVSRKILEKLQFSPAAPIRFHDPITGVPLPAEALYLDNPDSTQ